MATSVSSPRRSWLSRPTAALVALGGFARFPIRQGQRKMKSVVGAKRIESQGIDMARRSSLRLDGVNARLGALPRSLVITIAGLLVFVGSPHAEAYHGQTRSTIGAPFSGRWGNGVGTVPTGHHIVFGGDWSVDFYAGPGTAVRPKLWSDDWQNAATLKVTSLRMTCSSGVYGHGGRSVRVSVTIKGATVGWVDYSHTRERSFIYHGGEGSQSGFRPRLYGCIRLLIQPRRAFGQDLLRRAQ